MRADTNDEALAKHAQQGDREAFLVLYNRYLVKVYNRVKSRVPPTDVEDVVQDIFIAVIRSLKGFEQRSQFNTWLYTIVNRQIADFYRKRHRTGGDKEHVSLDEVENSPVVAVSDQDQLDEQALVKRALGKIPEHYREIILMRFVDRYTFAEIADLSGKSLDAVKSLYRRAIEAIREQVSDR